MVALGSTLITINHSQLKSTKMETDTIIAMPRIGDMAPEFKAVTTQGDINFPSDYSGKWIILFTHPADFTPVCTSEFMTFATMEPVISDPPREKVFTLPSGFAP